MSWSALEFRKLMRLRMFSHELREGSSGEEEGRDVFMSLLSVNEISENLNILYY